MKKLFKRTAALALTAAMAAMAFTGCGGSDAATTATAVNDGAVADTNNDAAGGVLKIGGIGPVTGGAAVYGLAVKNAAELAVKEINAAGGINGMQVEFKFEDDVHDAEKSVNAYNSLKDWGMEILMGTVTSTPCQGIASAQYIGENKLAEKVAVIYDSSDVYSTGIYEKFAAEAENQPFEIVSAESFTSESKSDFTVQITKAKDAGADLVFLPIYYQEASLILQQADKLGYKPSFFGCDGLDGLLDVANFDLSLTEGVMLLTPFAADATDEMTVNFVKAYKEAYGDTPIQFAADAYDALYIIKAAAEKANITADMSVSEMGDALKAAMTEITVDGLTGSGMTWSADGEPSKAPKAVKIVTTTAEDGTVTGTYAAM